MTKKDFELIAETVANLPYGTLPDSLAAGAEVITRETLVRELADMCASTNGNFDRGRFVNACMTDNYRAPRNVTRY